MGNANGNIREFLLKLMRLEVNVFDTVVQKEHLAAAGKLALNDFFQLPDRALP